MNLEIKREKLTMETTAKIQALPGTPSDDGKTLKFPIIMPVGDKNASLADVNVAFESRNDELLANVSVTYYDAADGTPKTYPLQQFKVNTEQILLNNGIEKTNDDEQVITSSSPTSATKQGKKNNNNLGD